jgi:hypothetical protein
VTTRSLQKPRLVFFQFRYDDRLPNFLLLHKQDHVNCLSHFFDVTVIHDDCDYDEICDRYQPDLALFESGVNHVTCRRPNIINTAAHAAIPKLALHNADAFCNARAGLLSDMDHWNIETAFAISTTAAEHTPALANNLFIWPNFVDPTVYRDYAERKVIPVLLTGNRNSLYPWRKKILPLIAQHYPSLICPHPGYEVDPVLGNFLYGERYARMINASLVVPTCGTVAREVIRKHFEIPACRACLITERSPALAAAGFVDMQNCIFADERDILDKLAHLFRHEDELQNITDAGYDLVRTRHTVHHRNQILQWYDLRRDLAPGHKIVQDGPFGSLTTVPTSTHDSPSPHINGSGLHLSLLHQGDRRLRAGRWRDAEKLYMKCINFMPWMPEPRLKLALCSLHQGDAAKARGLIEPLLSFLLVDYKATDPDPVEWAYSIIALLCLGKLQDARDRARAYPWLHHPELDRTRWIALVLADEKDVTLSFDGDVSRSRRSIHQLPNRSFHQLCEQVFMMLRACGQHQSAAVLERASSGASWASAPFLDSQRAAPASRRESRVREPRRGADAGWAALARHPSTSYLHHTMQSGLGCLRRAIAGFLHGAEAKWGYFLPYRLSEMRNDEFYKIIREFIREEPLQTTLIVGAASGKGSTEAFLAGLHENPSVPSVFCLSNERRPPRWDVSHPIYPSVKWYTLPLAASVVEIGEVIRDICLQNSIRSFDAVLIDSSAFHHQSPHEDILKGTVSEARLVFLEDTNRGTFDTYHRLLENLEYISVAENPDLRRGYGVFKRRNSRAPSIPQYFESKSRGLI